MTTTRWIAAGLLALAGCKVMHTSLSTSSTPGPRVAASGPAGAVNGGARDLVVPDLVGKSEEEAAAIVEQAGFQGGVDTAHMLECEDPQEVEGKINCQNPDAGATARSYISITVHVYHAQHLVGLIVRAQMESLVGMTPDEAKQALRSYGHDGEVTVERGPSDADCSHCEVGEVCGFDQPSSGMGTHDPITLYTRRR